MWRVLFLLLVASTAASADSLRPRAPEAPQPLSRQAADWLAPRSAATTTTASTPRRPLVTAAARVDEPESPGPRRAPSRLDAITRLVPPAIPPLGAAPSLVELLSDGLRGMSSQLVTALILTVLLGLFRRVFADDRHLLHQSRGAQRSTRTAAVLLALQLIARVQFPGLQRPLLLLSLIALVMAATQLTALYGVDAALGRARGVRIPVIVRDVSVVVVFAAVSMVVLAAFGFDLSGVLTGSAILTAVVGLAFQDTLGSLASGLALQLERPFKIGRAHV